MLPERLKKLRKKAGLTQKQIAEKLQVGQNSYSNWEKGNRTPIQPTIEKLAEILNTSSEYLTGITDDPTRLKISEADIDTAIDNSVAYDGTPITDNDREIIKDFLKDYFANKK
jgi:HTH-type transcriptional regulator xre